MNLSPLGIQLPFTTADRKIHHQTH